MRVVVTGANGFIGSAVCAELSRRGHEVTACVRTAQAAEGLACAKTAIVGSLEAANGNLAGLFDGADSVVHAANWSGGQTDVSEDYVQSLNVCATARLARAAVQAGVGQFVYLSSVKAVADRTQDIPINVATVEHPSDMYGRSKLAAERVLLDTAGLPTTIIRPPVVYGPGVKGGILTLFKLASRQIPLPLRSIKNSRDLLAVTTLANLIAVCVEKPLASNRVLLARDGERVSSAELYQRIGAALGKSAVVFPCPKLVLHGLAALSGRTAAADSLVSSLEIDDMETRRQLSWAPPEDMRIALQATADWFYQAHASRGA